MCSAASSKRAVGVGRLALAAQAQSAPGVDVDVAGEEAARPAEGDLRLQRVIEIFAGDLIQMVRDPRAQRVGHIDLLAGNRDLHRLARLRPESEPRRQAGTAFSRLRCTELGMRSASRYLATVRRAMSTPSRRSAATIASSDRTLVRLLRPDQRADAVAHRLGAVRLARRCRAIAVVKKYFSSNVPRGVAMYLLAVTRLTVLSCISTASAMSRRISGRRCATPWRRKPSCWRTISARHLQDGLRPLLQRLAPASWRFAAARP